jgi:hypothetical protein
MHREETMEKTWITYLLVVLLIVGPLLIVYRQMERRNRKISKEKTKSREASKDDTATFRVRFRFKVQKFLNIKEHEYRFKVGQREVVMSPQLPETSINQSEWLVMNARGFNSETDAREFAGKLKAAAEISSVATRLGIDSGIDAPTAGLGQSVKDHIRQQDGLLVRDNVHGVEVFPDNPNVRIFHVNLTASVLTEPNPFLSDLTVFLDATESLSQKAKDIILLLNYALMRPEPVAQIFFAISAVEMLGQEDWSADQIHLLEKLAIEAESETIGTVYERREVSDAIKRSLHKIGLLQGVMRLLDDLGLSHLKREWKRLYRERSKLVHGLAPKPGADYGGLALETVTLCGQILLKMISKEVTVANSYVDKFYKVSSLQN